MSTEIPRDRPADEIDVTSVMAAAGDRILADFYDEAPETAARHAILIFRDMVDAAPSGRERSCDETT
jgi:hypothetical protein